MILCFYLGVSVVRCSLVLRISKKCQINVLIRCYTHDTQTLEASVVFLDGWKKSMAKLVGLCWSVTCAFGVQILVWCTKLRSKYVCFWGLCGIFKRCLLHLAMNGYLHNRYRRCNWPASLAQQVNLKGHPNVGYSCLGFWGLTIPPIWV